MTSPDGEWTFAFVDLAGFTALTETHGDEQAADLAMALSTLATSELEGEERLVKTIGDAVLLAAPDPRSGLRLVGRIVAGCYALADYPVPRAGLHHGPAVVRGDDMFGAAINLAARVAAQASGRQVLATQVVAEAARAEGIPVQALGDVELRNVEQPTALYEVKLFDPPGQGVIDPVCRMHLLVEASRDSREVGDVTYWFCSQRCVDKFDLAPARYTKFSR